MIKIDLDHITEAEQVKIDAWTADANLWHNEILRPERNKRLVFYDRHQLQLSWEELSQSEQQEFRHWRKAMKKMTVTYPTYTALKDINWPADCSFFEAYSE